MTTRLSKLSLPLACVAGLFTLGMLTAPASVVSAEESPAVIETCLLPSNDPYGSSDSEKTPPASVLPSVIPTPTDSSDQAAEPSVESDSPSEPIVESPKPFGFENIIKYLTSWLNYIIDYILNIFFNESICLPACPPSLDPNRMCIMMCM
ncbi:MAG: hypothetical protein LBL92_04985 [Propionibacteriaceae bacterium]|jgi:hypothetical protein|nr:hypothetical protein [Propionibacteriaceae bacterium]